METKRQWESLWKDSLETIDKLYTLFHSPEYGYSSKYHIQLRLSPYPISQRATSSQPNTCIRIGMNGVYIASIFCHNIMQFVWLRLRLRLSVCFLSPALPLSPPTLVLDCQLSTKIGLITLKLKPKQTQKATYLKSVCLICIPYPYQCWH